MELADSDGAESGAEEGVKEERETTTQKCVEFVKNGERGREEEEADDGLALRFLVLPVFPPTKDGRTELQIFLPLSKWAR